MTEDKYSRVIDPGELTLVYPDGSKHKVILGSVWIDFERAYKDKLKEYGIDA